jgi:hypothetical protein
MRSDSVIGCVVCAKPAALVGDDIPDETVARACLMCPWCLAARRPGAFGAWSGEEMRTLRKALRAAASSLAVIAEGRVDPDDPQDMMQVRGYAQSRANVAKATLGDDR